MLNGKATMVLFTVGQIKKTVQISQFFPEPKSSEGIVKVGLDLFNYATEADLLRHQNLLKKLI